MCDNVDKFYQFHSSITDGELEAQWLVAAGFSQLTKAFQEVRQNTVIRSIKKKKSTNKTVITRAVS